MKIGAFAELHGASIDAVRHYMDMGLLLPEKRGGQYDFDNRCGSDLEEIHSLKAMGFTLAEIRTVFMFRRLGSMTAGKQDALVQEMFVNKRGRILELMEEWKQIGSRLESKIRELENVQPEERLRLGVQIANLAYLQCPFCGGSLLLRKGQIEDGQIMDGSLSCQCGREVVIRDGILMGREQDDTAETGESQESQELLEFRTTAEIDSQVQISDYIRNTDEMYLSNVAKSLEWGRRRLNPARRGGRVLLELGSGLGFFLRLIYDELPESTLYIAVDHDIRMQRYLKDLLEHSGKRRNILFICSDFLQIPIREKAADIVLDLTGTSNYSFEHEEFLLNRMLRYFKANSELLGSYILFGNFSANSKVSPAFRKNFRLETIRKEIAALGFEIQEELITEHLDKGGKYESFFTPGERVNSCVFHAKRSGAHEV